MVNNEIKIGDIVDWLGSSYTVVDIKGDGLILKQNFSIKTVLIKPVKIDYVTKK